MNIPLFKICSDENDVDRVGSVIRRGMHWAIGPEVSEFEQKVAEYVGVRYAFAVNSGTSALHAALAGHGIGEGDEVIVPSFTFIATANAPLFVGARPVFAEIEDKTYGLDPADVESKITPRTKAIMPIHYGGSPCRVEGLKQITQRYSLILIEDAAESIGAAVNGKKVCSFGNSAVVSFCAPKVITMGEGGIVLTDDRDLYERVKLICSHGRAETADYFSAEEQSEYITLGYNFRMSTMTAALGITQLEKIDDIIRMRQDNARYLTEQLSQIEGIEVPATPDGYFQVYQMYTIRIIRGEDVRDGLKEYLVRNGIAARIYYDPVHLSVFYRNKFGYKGGELPVTETICQEVLTLPMYPGLTRPEIECIAETIGDYMSAGR